MNITISGLPGSGKTTVAELLERKLGMKYIYSGQVFREKAKIYGMTLAEFSAYAEHRPEIDQEIDETQKDILLKGNVILEGRLAGWIAYKHSIPARKIWLQCDQPTRIQRIVKREGTDLEKKKKETLQRELSEKKRYKEYYQIDISDTSIYDMIIDTTKKTPQEIVHMIISAFSEVEIESCKDYHRGREIAEHCSGIIEERGEEEIEKGVFCVEVQPLEELVE